MELLLGERLKITRIISKKTLDEVSEETKIGKGALSRYENNKQLPKLDTLERIEKSIGKLISKDIVENINRE
ncbi:helix-turn-helix domain-containing protein [Streptobacillus moniliformis]|uniref:helix-turn-helix domain-containing protein n=1 Tax=Streptobacillus moniliformis TaxID=34105 RepID=UPI0007E32864|nr:helix-turn-helix transcriptional regulator [Streptobacillus moniliformis]